MSIAIIKVSQPRVQVRIIQRIVSDALKSVYPTAGVVVSRYNPPKSRAAQFAEAMEHICEAKDKIESLREELEAWYDNLPENLQQGEKADQLQEAISNLESLIGDLEQVDGVDVEFPGMY